MPALDADPEIPERSRIEPGVEIPAVLCDQICEGFEIMAQTRDCEGHQFVAGVDVGVLVFLLPTPHYRPDANRHTAPKFDQVADSLGSCEEILRPFVRLTDAHPLGC